MRRSLVVLAFAVYLACLGFLVLWPTHIDRNLDVASSLPARALVDLFGLTRSQAYTVIEFSANIALFVPLGFLIAALTKKSGPEIVLISFVFSALVEAIQAIWLPQRTASVFDVTANTIGGALGVALMALALRIFRRTSSLSAPRE